MPQLADLFKKYINPENVNSLVDRYEGAKKGFVDDLMGRSEKPDDAMFIDTPHRSVGTPQRVNPVIQDQVDEDDRDLEEITNEGLEALGLAPEPLREVPPVQVGPQPQDQPQTQLPGQMMGPESVAPIGPQAEQPATQGGQTGSPVPLAMPPKQVDLNSPRNPESGQPIQDQVQDLVGQSPTHKMNELDPQNPNSQKNISTLLNSSIRMLKDIQTVDKLPGRSGAALLQAKTKTAAYERYKELVDTINAETARTEETVATLFKNENTAKHTLSLIHI